MREEGEREVICKLGNHQRGISFLIFNFFNFLIFYYEEVNGT